MFPIFQTRRGSRDRCFRLAREEDRRASHKRRQTSWNLTRGLKWWELAIGLAVASGGETETMEEDYRSGGPIIELEPDFETIQVCSKIWRTLVGHKIDESYYIVIALDGVHSSAVHSLFCLFFLWSRSRSWWENSEMRKDTNDTSRKNTHML